MYILQIIKDIFSILKHGQKVKLYFLIVFFIFSAVVQIVGVASIAPFITLLSNPNVIHSNDLFRYAYEISGAVDIDQFIVRFAGLSLLMIFLSNAISALSMWTLIRYSVAVGSLLQRDLYANFLCRPYIYHKTTNYNSIISAISAEAPRFVYMVMQPFLLLVSQSLVAAIILLGLLVLNPVIAVVSATVVGGSYLATYLYVKKSLLVHGKALTERNDKMQSVLAESFSGIKEVKLSSLEKNYIKRLNEINSKGLASQAVITLAGDLPRYVIETISFGAILVLAIILFVSSGSSDNVISVLSIYALAGYKLLPTLQQVYKSVASMSANGFVVSKLRHELGQPVDDEDKSAVNQLETVSDICMNDVTYQYPSAIHPAVKDLSVKFGLGKLNTIAGPSGSGKSTLVDIMLGLLLPAKGHVYVNGILASGTYLAEYQRSIGYVPQGIFILDDTVIANVAFGVPKEQIDIAQVNKALEQANAVEFVSKMPQGVYSVLGQDGKGLSGGQKQRIGIARSLYHRSQILILDEPTSALDIHSEHEIMNLLNSLKNEVLIVVISHRPAAIKLSDYIVIVEKGSLLDSGSPEELLQNSTYFRQMLNAGHVHDAIL